MTIRRFPALFATILLAVAAAPVTAAESSFAAELAALQHEFDRASFQTTEKHARKAAFQALVEHATGLSARYRDHAEAVAWEGIVLSAFAGEVGAMSAMKYAKAARTALLEAERRQPECLEGGVLASLGALYSKVPGGFIGFGDDDLAAEYFAKAIAVDPDNIDSNFFYGEFLIDQGNYAEAVLVLNRALSAPAVAARPVFDNGRRREIKELLETAQRKAS